MPPPNRYHLKGKGHQTTKLCQLVWQNSKRLEATPIQSDWLGFWRCNVINPPKANERWCGLDVYVLFPHSSVIMLHFATPNPLPYVPPVSPKVAQQLKTEITHFAFSHHKVIKQGWLIFVRGNICILFPFRGLVWIPFLWNYFLGGPLSGSKLSF